MTSFRSLAFLAGASLLTLAPLAASAAPAYAPSGAVDWSGAYAGMHVGIGFADFSGGTTTKAGPNDSDTSALGGVQVGYNWQMDRIVLGGEADFSLFQLNGTGPNGKLDENWMSTIRARGGYTFGPWLPYATVGVGLTNTDSETAGGSANNTHAGYALGAGVDYSVYDNLSARVEYLHVDVPEESDSINGRSFNGGSSNNVIRIGANYRFR